MVILTGTVTGLRDQREDSPGCEAGSGSSHSTSPGTAGPPGGTGSCSAQDQRGSQGTSSPLWAGWFCFKTRTHELRLMRVMRVRPSGRQVTLPEVPVHTAEHRSPVRECPDSLLVAPGPAHIPTELKHHWGDKAGGAGQDVASCTESGRPRSDHRYPLQHPVVPFQREGLDLPGQKHSHIKDPDRSATPPLPWRLILGCYPASGLSLILTGSNMYIHPH